MWPASEVGFWIVATLCFASLAIVWSLTFTLFQAPSRGHPEVSRLLQEPYDGEKVQLAKGERVALNGEAAYQNGIYVFNGHTLDRAPDMCRDEQLFTGSHVYVRDLGEQVVLQVLANTGRKGKWKGMSKGVRFITKKEHVFGKRREKGLLRATDDGFVFDAQEEVQTSEAVEGNIEKFLVIPMSKRKVGHTYVTLIGNNELFWRATVFFDEQHMRLVNLFDHDGITLHLDEKASPRGQSLHIDLLLKHDDNITVHAVTP